jgi:prevent-host-death family protein
MKAKVTLGIEQTRARLPQLVQAASAGQACVITRHGRPHAALVPISALEKISRSERGGVLALQGSGEGLWTKNIGQHIQVVRAEWED